MVGCTAYDNSVKMVSCRGFCQRKLHGFCIRAPRNWYHPSLDEFFICSDCQNLQSYIKNMEDGFKQKISSLNDEKDCMISKLKSSLKINEENFLDMAKSFDNLNSKLSDTIEIILSKGNLSTLNPSVEEWGHQFEKFKTFTMESIADAVSGCLHGCLNAELSPSISEFRDLYNALIANQISLSSRIDELYISKEDATAFDVPTKSSEYNRILSDLRDMKQELNTLFCKINTSPSIESPVTVTPALSDELARVSSSPLKKAPFVPETVIAEDECLTWFFIKGAPLHADIHWLKRFINNKFTIAITHCAKFTPKKMTTRLQSSYSCFKFGIPKRYDWLIINQNSTTSCWDSMKVTKWSDKPNSSSFSSNISPPLITVSNLNKVNISSQKFSFNNSKSKVVINLNKNNDSPKPNSNIIKLKKNKETPKPNSNKDNINTVSKSNFNSRKNRISKSKNKNKNKNENKNKINSTGDRSNTPSPINTNIGPKPIPSPRSLKKSSSLDTIMEPTISNNNPKPSSVSFPNSSLYPNFSRPSCIIPDPSPIPVASTSPIAPNISSAIARSPSFIDPLLPPIVKLTLLSAGDADNKFLLSRLRDQKLFDNVRLYLSFLHNQPDSTCINGKTKSYVQLQLQLEGLPIELSSLRTLFDKFNAMYSISPEQVSSDLDSFASQLRSDRICQLNRYRIDSNKFFRPL